MNTNPYKPYCQNNEHDFIARFGEYRCRKCNMPKSKVNTIKIKDSPQGRIQIND